MQGIEGRSRIGIFLIIVPFFITSIKAMADTPDAMGRKEWKATLDSLEIVDIVREIDGTTVDYSREKGFTTEGKRTEADVYLSFSGRTATKQVTTPSTAQGIETLAATYLGVPIMKDEIMLRTGRATMVSQLTCCISGVGVRTTMAR